MGIYIHGMSLPKEATFLGIYKLNGKWFFTSNGVRYELIELPCHGRLIDADAFNRNIAKVGMKFDPFMAAGVIAFVNDAPTIILADPEEEETT